MELRITTLIASGDHDEALELIATAFGRPALRYCAALVGSRAEGEEVYQETLIETYGALPRFRGSGGIRAWFFGIARRVCSRHLRRRDRRRSLWERFGTRHESFVPPDPVEQTQTHAALSAALLALKPRWREAVLLQYQAGLSGPEVATALGISHAAARKRVSLGIRSLREALDPILADAEAFDGLLPQPETPSAPGEQVRSPGSAASPITSPKTSLKEASDVAMLASDRPRVVRS